MLTPQQKLLKSRLLRNGFDEAAAAVKDFTARSHPKWLERKLKAWDEWQAANGWPWNQYDKVSRKDWYAIRESCPF